jgi:hypothetical protein
MRHDAELGYELCLDEPELDDSQAGEARVRLEQEFRNLWLARGERRVLRLLAWIADAEDAAAALEEDRAA